MKRNDVEAEANLFAVLLLIPKYLLLQEMEKYKFDLAGPRHKKEKEDIQKLCETFGVSLTAMAYRLSLLHNRGI